MPSAVTASTHVHQTLSHRHHVLVRQRRHLLGQQGLAIAVIMAEDDGLAVSRGYTRSAKPGAHPPTLSFSRATTCLRTRCD